MGYCPVTWRGTDRGQVWAIAKRHFEMTLSSDGTTQSDRCGGPLQLTEISDDSCPNTQWMFWFGRWELHSSLLFELRLLKAGPVAVLQAVIGLVSGSRHGKAWSSVGGWGGTLMLHSQGEMCAFAF